MCSEKITNEDNVVITIKFKNGSIGNLTYLANGDKGLPKEYIEVFGAGKTAVIHDFHSAELFKNNKSTTLKSDGKGHKEEVKEFITVLSEGKDSPISFRSICLTTLTTFKILDSLHTGLSQTIELNA
jgi:polar amino acid transport system substrate-binding protein